jgi:DNA polymerase-1
MGDHLILVDGSGFIFRAFYALPPMTRRDGLPTGAVLGFCNMLWRLLRAGPMPGERHDATHLAIVFDNSRSSFRREAYPAYKANRTAPRPDLVPQFGLIRAATRAFNVASLELFGWEADDLIATYATQAAERGMYVTIVSADKDLLQLVRPGVRMVDTMKNVAIDREGVRAKFGVYPERMADLQALTGDSGDNVPGVPGIGPKTAAELLAQFGDVETVLRSAGTIRQPARRSVLIRFADQVRLARRLVQLSTDVPIEVPLEELTCAAIDDQAIAFCKAMEFSVLAGRVAEMTGADPDGIAAARLEIEGWP